MTNLERERKAQCLKGADPGPVERVVVSISKCASPADATLLFEQLEREANKLSWPYDRDFAAVALQHYAGQTVSAEMRNSMLSLAIERARWCAACATAGGEGFCRAEHINELKALLNQ